MTAPSSSGRTPDFESGSLGSNPSGASKHDFGTHEILDRAAMAHHFFNENVLEHRRLEQFPNLRRMALVADTALAEFYQACGQEFLTLDNVK